MPRLSTTFATWILALSLISFTACSSNNDPFSVEDSELPVEELYNQAADALDEKKYQQATRDFELVERQYPYSKWATRAELMAAYASYKDERYDDAIMALDRFVELHPGNRNIDYALYLKALSYYERIVDVARDQAMTKRALDAFNALIRRFPDSRYARDSRFKRDLVLDHLAGKEMEIGRYYLNRRHLNAAINRFRTVVRDYQTTTHTPEALHRMVEAYVSLGLNDEATRIASVLGHNYPGSNWYEDTYRLLDDKQRQEIIEGRTWLSKTVDSLFKPD